MASLPGDFVEYEHKYIMDTKSRAIWCKKAMQLDPIRTNEIRVEDYYWLASDGQKVLRHRFDHELSELTLKGIAGDPESRTEINLGLERGLGKQECNIASFAAYLGFREIGSVHKHVHLFLFPDCEIVFYDASHNTQSVACLEVEAKGASNQSEALEILCKYEKLLGLDSKERSHRSLFEIFFGLGAKDRESLVSV